MQDIIIYTIKNNNLYKQAAIAFLCANKVSHSIAASQKAREKVQLDNNQKNQYTKKHRNLSNKK